LAQLYFGCRLHADQCGGTAGFGLMDVAATALETAGNLREISSIWDANTWRLCMNESQNVHNNS